VNPAGCQQSSYKAAGTGEAEILCLIADLRRTGSGQEWHRIIHMPSLTGYPGYMDYLSGSVSTTFSILAQNTRQTGEASTAAPSLSIHESAGFYSNIGSFLDMHERLFPNVRSVTMEQSRRLTQVLFQHKLVRRLD
jgi:hypothetical protein